MVKNAKIESAKRRLAKRKAAKWQYELFSSPTATPLIKIQDDLKLAGLEGWELVSVFALPDNNVFVYKKPAARAASRRSVKPR